MTIPKYQYNALSTVDSVRLLTVSEADDQPHGLHLSLAEARLDDEPDFAALSYTWHLPEYADTLTRTSRGLGRTFDVVCDTQTLTISENLFNFLRAVLHARKDAKDAAPNLIKTKLTKVTETMSALPIWIDALCIHQADAAEKQRQVLLMHRIYSSAQAVLVWLGPAAPDSDVLWIHDVFIPAISKLTRSKPRFVERYLKPDPLCRSAEVMIELGPDMCTRWAAAWLALASMIGRHRWFDRGWVVQEVALADPGGVFLLCGGAALSWKRLTAFAQFLRETGWCTSLGERFEKELVGREGTPAGKNRFAGVVDLSDKIGRISQARQAISGFARQAGLFDGALDTCWDQRVESAWFACANFLIHSLRSSDFEDKRDHIYGCLGMLSMLLPGRSDSPIVPDYELSAEEVFTSTAFLFLQKGPLFLELSRVRGTHRNAKLPSWVPDYSAPSPRRPSPNHSFALNRYLDLNPDQLNRAETRIWGTSLRRPILKASVLSVHAFRLGVVAVVGEDEPFRWTSEEIQGSVAYLTMNAMSSLDSSPQTNFWDALASMMMFQCTKGTALEPQYKEFFDEQWDQHVKKVSSPGSSQEAQSNCRPPFLEKPEKYPFHVDQSVLDELVDGYIYLTKDGRLGLGPLTAQPGHEIWLVEGARVPFVLQKVSLATVVYPERYKLVGETDLYGFDIESTDNTSEEQRGFFHNIELV